MHYVQDNSRGEAMANISKAIQSIGVAERARQDWQLKQKALTMASDPSMSYQDIVKAIAGSSPEYGSGVQGVMQRFAGNFAPPSEFAQVLGGPLLNAKLPSSIAAAEGEQAKTDYTKAQTGWMNRRPATTGQTRPLFQYNPATKDWMALEVGQDPEPGYMPAVPGAPEKNYTTEELDRLRAQANQSNAAAGKNQAQTLQIPADAASTRALQESRTGLTQAQTTQVPLNAQSQRDVNAARIASSGINESQWKAKRMEGLQKAVDEGWASEQDTQELKDLKQKFATPKADTFYSETTKKNYYVTPGNQEALDALPPDAKKVTGGNTSLAVNVDTMQKSTAGDLEASLTGAINSMANMESVMRSYDPEYLTYGAKAKGWIQGMGEKLEGVPGAGLLTSQKNRQLLGKMSDWKMQASQFWNQYRKDITGAAAGFKELQWIASAVPNPETDSPTQFEAKARATMAAMKRVAEVNRALRSDKLPMTPENLSATWDKLRDQYGPVQTDKGEIVEPLRPDEVLVVDIKTNMQQIIKGWSKGTPEEKARYKVIKGEGMVAPTSTKEVTPAPNAITDITKKNPYPEYPDAIQGKDGKWYVPRDGTYKRIEE